MDYTTLNKKKNLLEKVSSLYRKNSYICTRERFIKTYRILAS